MIDAFHRHPVIAGATLAYLSAFAAAGPELGWRRVVPYLLVVSTVALVVAAIDRRRPLPPAVLALISLLGLAHCLGGLVGSPAAASGVLYETWLVRGVLKYDQAVHFLGTGIAALAAWHLQRPGRTGIARRWRAGGIAMALGLLNEVVEHGVALGAVTLVGGLDNAAWDLVFNAAGALTVVLLVRPAADTTTVRPARRAPTPLVG